MSWEAATCKQGKYMGVEPEEEDVFPPNLRAWYNCTSNDLFKATGSNNNCHEGSQPSEKRCQMTWLLLFWKIGKWKWVFNGCISDRVCNLTVSCDELEQSMFAIFSQKLNYFLKSRKIWNHLDFLEGALPTEQLLKRYNSTNRKLEDLKERAGPYLIWEQFKINT